MRGLIGAANRRRIEGIAEVVDECLPPSIGSLLDVGCGDGELAGLLLARRAGLVIEGLEVVVPPACQIAVREYDGRSLPFADGSFDAVLAADMLHHTTDPGQILAEALRVARQLVVVKDHVVEGRWERKWLALLDWIGNVGSGVPMPYNFLSAAEWDEVFERLEARVVWRRDRLEYWPWPVSAVLDRNFHFVTVIRRDAVANGRVR